jgi:DNA adenine methylase
MKCSSPLRYPGGKSAMTGLINQIRKLNGFGDRAIAEPFAGGAGASLSLLYLEETLKIFINDADKSIYDFWWSVLHRIEPFVDQLTTIKVNMREWRRQRTIYKESGRISRLQRGFAAFYLNRCNRSGIIMNGGPIGGVKQTGIWKLDARFNKPELKRRCEKVSEYRDRIDVSCRDGIEFIRDLEAKSVLFFIDPPYYVKGPTLYLNALDHNYHLTLAAQLKTMKDAAWVLTYDDCPEIRKMYRGWATIRPFSLRYSAAERRSGKEVLIVPKWVRLPSSELTGSLKW